MVLRQQSHILQPSLRGVVRLGLKEVTYVCQIGDKICADSPMQVLVAGKRPGSDNQVVLLVSVDH